MQWVKAEQQEPKIGDYYYCKIWDDYSQERKAIVEWAEKRNGEHKYYDWCLSDLDSWYGVREETKVVEWLDESESEPLFSVIDWRELKEKFDVEFSVLNNGFINTDKIAEWFKSQIQQKENNVTKESNSDVASSAPLHSNEVTKIEQMSLKEMQLAEDVERAINTINFLHNCLTDKQFVYTYPEHTKATIEKLKEYQFPFRYCGHSVYHKDCKSCEQRVIWQRHKKSLLSRSKNKVTTKTE
jgi:hypothetical protein